MISFPLMFYSMTLEEKFHYLLKAMWNDLFDAKSVSLCPYHCDWNFLLGDALSYPYFSMHCEFNFHVNKNQTLNISLHVLRQKSTRLIFFASHLTGSTIWFIISLVVCRQIVNVMCMPWNKPEIDNKKIDRSGLHGLVQGFRNLTSWTDCFEIKRIWSRWNNNLPDKRLFIKSIPKGETGGYAFQLAT